MDINLALQSFGIVFLILTLIMFIDWWAPLLFVAVLFIFSYATLAVINEDMEEAKRLRHEATQIREVQTPKQRPAVFEQGKLLIDVPTLSR